MSNGHPAGSWSCVAPRRLGEWVVLGGLLAFVAGVAYLGYRHLHRPGPFIYIRHEGLVLYRGPETGGKFDIGWAYDRAVLDVRTVAGLVVPHDARVEQGGIPMNRAEVYLEKRLARVGNLRDPMTIRGARRNMGCVCKPDSGRLVLATYGEACNFDGETTIALLVRVPDGVPVERQGDLSGPNSRGQRWDDGQVPPPLDPANGPWWGARISPAPGWVPVPSVPDPDFTGHPIRIP
jgi:hypothetical protein